MTKTNIKILQALLEAANARSEKLMWEHCGVKDAQCSHDLWLRSEAMHDLAIICAEAIKAATERGNP